MKTLVGQLKEDGVWVDLFDGLLNIEREQHSCAGLSGAMVTSWLRERPPTFPPCLRRFMPEKADDVPVQEEPAPSVPAVDGRPVLSQPPLPIRGVPPHRVVSP